MREGLRAGALEPRRRYRRSLLDDVPTPDPSRKREGRKDMTWFPIPASSPSWSAPRARRRRGCAATSTRSSTFRSAARARPTSCRWPTSAPSRRSSRNCRSARPDWGFLMEERGEIAGDPDKPRWIVDPLDGTTNFLHGIPHFAISIAVEEPLAERQARDHHRRWSISRSPTRASGPKRAGAPGCRSSACAFRRGATWPMR